MTKTIFPKSTSKSFKNTSRSASERTNERMDGQTDGRTNERTKRYLPFFFTIKFVLQMPDFDMEKMKSISKAAYGICSWINAIVVQAHSHTPHTTHHTCTNTHASAVARAHIHTHSEIQQCGERNTAKETGISSSKRRVRGS